MKNPFEKPLTEEEINKAVKPLEVDKEMTKEEMIAEKNIQKIGGLIKRLGEHVLEANDQQTIDKVNNLRQDLLDAAKRMSEKDFDKYAYNAVENLSRDYE